MGFTIENDKVRFIFNPDTELTLDTYDPPAGMKYYSTLSSAWDDIVCPGCNVKISVTDGYDLYCNSIKVLISGMHVYVSI